MPVRHISIFNFALASTSHHYVQTARRIAMPEKEKKAGPERRRTNNYAAPVGLGVGLQEMGKRSKVD